MSDSTPTIRVRAAVQRVHDGDTYLLLLDLHGRGLHQGGCATEWVRLRDYSCRELADTAPTDPKGYGRVDGPTATAIATRLLTAATEIVVELLGSDVGQVSSESFGRFVGWIWLDGQSFGDLLVAQNAAVKGRFEGLT